MEVVYGARGSGWCAAGVNVGGCCGGGGAGGMVRGGE